MKRKLLLCLGLSLTYLLCNQSTLLHAENEELIVYQTNFENMTVDKNNTVDSKTGFIWANNWQSTITEKHNGSTMLKCPIIDSNDYSIVGGFGIASNMNLSLCNNGETYQTTTYLEMQNIEKMYVEFVGGEEKWGSFVINSKNNKIECNSGGDNIFNVSYENNTLTFNFTMAYNSVENCNGYIKFTAYNTHNGIVYFDNVKISYDPLSYQNTFENDNVGQFITTDSLYLGNIYTDSSKTEIIEKSGNKSLDISYTAKGNSGVTAAFLNHLGFLNRNREYEFSLDLKFDNVTKFYLYYGGTWVKPESYLSLNISNGNIDIYGNVIKSATFTNNKLIVRFVVSSTINDYKQFQMITESKDSSKATINIDNIIFKQTPIVTKISIDATKAKTRFNYGEEYEKTGLKVIATYSNNTIRVLEDNEYEVTNYDKFLEGKQLLTIKANGIETTYEIVVVREAISIELDTTNVKKEYAYGEDIDLTNLIVKASYFDGSFKELKHDVINNGYSINLGEFDAYKSGKYEIMIIYENVKATFQVKVLDKDKTSFDGINYEEM